jgi:hypothetical protein
LSIEWINRYGLNDKPRDDRTEYDKKDYGDIAGREASAVRYWQFVVKEEGTEILSIQCEDIKETGRMIEKKNSS